MNSKQIITLLSGLCWDLSQFDKIDAFFSYYPHVNSIDIGVIIDGKYSPHVTDKKAYAITLCLPEHKYYSVYAVQRCADELKGLIYECEEKLTGQANDG